MYSGLIDAAWENSMYDCITASLKKTRQRVLAINGTADHIHVLIGFKPNVSLEEIQQVIRITGADFINKNVLTESSFNWQALLLRFLLVIKISMIGTRTSWIKKIFTKKFHFKKN
ncbi:hypothetical protein BH10BAC3_BH10BAC3_22740 [soil metagenome]